LQVRTRHWKICTSKPLIKLDPELQLDYVISKAYFDWVIKILFCFRRKELWWFQKRSQSLFGDFEKAWRFFLSQVWFEGNFNSWFYKIFSRKYLKLFYFMFEWF
jgi:hypothetical protein